MPEQTADPSSAPADSDDLALARRYLEGEDAAFALLVERHDRKLRALARGLVGPGPQAEDARQDVLLEVLQSLPSFRGECAFSTWLYRLAVRVCLDLRDGERKRGSTASLDAANGEDEAEVLSLPSVDPAVHPEPAAVRRWLADRLRLWLRDLPPLYRAPIVLADALEVPGPEVAAVLSISLPALKARIRRGRQMLRDRVNRYCLQAGIAGWRDLME